MILRDFRQQLEQVINQSGLPIDVIYFVLKDVFNEVVDIYNNEITNEEAAKQQEEANGKKLKKLISQNWANRQSRLMNLY